RRSPGRWRWIPRAASCMTAAGRMAATAWSPAFASIGVRYTWAACSSRRCSRSSCPRRWPEPVTARPAVRRAPSCSRLARISDDDRRDGPRAVAPRHGRGARPRRSIAATRVVGCRAGSLRLIARGTGGLWLVARGAGVLLSVRGAALRAGLAVPGVVAGRPCVAARRGRRAVARLAGRARRLIRMRRKACRAHGATLMHGGAAWCAVHGGDAATMEGARPRRGGDRWRAMVHGGAQRWRAAGHAALLQLRRHRTTVLLAFPAALLRGGARRDPARAAVEAGAAVVAERGVANHGPVVDIANVAADM